MTNTETLFEIWKLMEENHINLYHDISKQDVEKYVTSLKDFNNLNSVGFDREMLKFFALFKDAHTNYFVPYENMNRKIVYIEDKFYIHLENKYYEVLKVGNMLPDDIKTQIISMQPFETDAWTNHKIDFSIRNYYYYKMLNLCDENRNISFVINKDGNEETIIANKHAKDESENVINTVPANSNYDHKLINDIIYIKYRKCKEHPDYPFADFVKNVKKTIKDNKIKKFIVDLRKNTGGDSEIIKPLIKLLKKQSLRGATLINNGVFSSGRWGVNDFKKELNSILIGEPTGGATKSYGFNKNLEVDGHKFSVSTRFWDFTNVFNNKGSIQPDIYIETTIKNIENGVDAQLDKAIEVVEKMEE